MAGKRTYELEILAKIDKALAEIEKLQEQSNKKLGSISMASTFSAMVEGFRLVEDVASKTFSTISSVLHASVHEAQEAEDANIKLANSLRLMGDLSEGALAQFDALGESIQSTTKFNNDMVKSSVAVAKQFKLTNSEAEKAVRVAVDLAAATGTTLDDATRKVAQTFNGFVDRDLAKVIPSLKDMGLASLVAGNALDVIGKRVQGTAAAFGNTFSGALFRATEAFKDILETMGNFVIQNPALIVGLNKLQNGFSGINDFLKANSKLIRNIVTDGFLLFIQAAPVLVETIKRVTSNLDFLFLNAQKAAVIIAQGPTAILQGLTGNGEFIDLLNEKLDQLNEKFGARQNARDDFFDPLIKKTKDLVKNTTEAVEKARNIAPAYQKIGQAATASLSGVGERIKELGDKFKEQIEKLSKDPVTVGFDLFITKHIEIRKEDQIAIGVGILNMITKGAQGASKLISQAVGGVADLLLPGIGGVVSEIVEVLGQGPEKTKEMVQGFVRAIPEFIKNLAESLPVLIETLVRELPPALAKAMPVVAVGFATALIKNMPQIIKGFVQGLIDGAKAFIQAIIDAIKDAAGAIFDGITGGGESDSIFAGIPILQGIGDIFGFADGGRTSKSPRLSGDRGLVRIGPNEQTFNSDLTDRMEHFLDRQESNGGGGDVYVTHQIVLNQQVLAEQMFKIRKAGYRT